MSETRPAYWVDVDTHGCQHCRKGTMWHVVHLENGEEVAGSQSYCDEDDADHEADILNDAFAQGKASLDLRGLARSVDLIQLYIDGFPNQQNRDLEEAVKLIVTFAEQGGQAA